MKSRRLGQIQEDVRLAATFGNAWRTALVARGGPFDPGADPTPRSLPLETSLLVITKRTGGH